MNTENKTEVRVLVNPFTPADKVVITKGTKCISMHPDDDDEMVFQRKQTVTVAHVNNGWVDPLFTGNETSSFSREVIEHKRVSTLVVFPRITYAGKGGYWKVIPLNEEILEANGIAPQYKVLGYVDKVSGSFKSA